ncbi:hypothetical protein A1332_09505 [Methylomonas methanica]|uniref:Glycosyltransferase RgtA/B/C/D-like domain-containing protein n=2 Tax=Methylomonas methanica TaxID=421 RepID=A0A177MND4_METMH|nr:hypothetical protein A1332_09505 [Methylomonas methanica]
MEPNLQYWVYFSALISVFMLHFFLKSRFGINLFYIRWGSRVGEIITKYVTPSQDIIENKPSVSILIAVVTVLYSLWFLIWNWMLGSSINLSTGSGYQYSDSHMYWICANSLLDFGNFGHPSLTGEWCQRRGIYPSLLAGIAWIGQRNIHATLILQAVLVSLSIYLCSRRALSVAGMFGVVISTSLLFVFAAENAFTMTMTENAGLIFGAIAFGVLFNACNRRSIHWIFVGIGIVSIALNARAGAFFVLPCLVIWTGIVARMWNKPVVNWLIAACGGVLIGFILQSLLVAAVGGNPGSSHGNFSYTLYGLSVGGKGWSQVQIDHPELIGSDSVVSRAIYQLAWENIVAHPLKMLDGLVGNFTLFFNDGTYGYKALGGFAIFVKSAWWLAWVPLFINRRNPRYLLVLLCSVGILLSVPFLLGDGGSRVFAATVPVDVMQMTIGFSWVVFFLMRAGKIATKPVSDIAQSAMELSDSKPYFDIGFVLVLFILLLVPYTPIRGLVNSESLVAPVCQEGEHSVTTMLGYNGTLLLDLVGSDIKPDFQKGQVGRIEFINRIPINSWWKEDASDFKELGSLLTVYQQDRRDPFIPGPWRIFSNSSLASYYGKNVQLCVDPNEVKTVFGETYRKLNLIKLLE